MMESFLGAMFGALVAAGLGYTYARHVILPSLKALGESLGIQTTMHGQSLDGSGPIAIPPPAAIGTDPCAVSVAILDIRRKCSCSMCRAVVGYEDMVRNASGAS